MSNFQTAEYFLAEAAQLREFAEEAVDEEVAEAYRRLAARFEAKARGVEVERTVH